VLADFGFAKKLDSNGRTFTKCGTPGYTAPEVLKQTEEETKEHSKRITDENANGYSYACDVWSWGVLVCELVGGYNPFTKDSKCIMDTFSNILNGRIIWPKNMPSILSQLLKKVFTNEPSQRITLAEIKKSIYFQVSVSLIDKIVGSELEQLGLII
jgi:serine/threonine protein kinase